MSGPEAIPDISLLKSSRLAVWRQCIAKSRPWLRKLLKRLEAIEFPGTATRWSQDSAQSEHPGRLHRCNLTVDRLPPLF